MTTLDELMEVFLAEAKGVYAISDADVRNGVAAVVCVLRDEVIPWHIKDDPRYSALELVRQKFIEILGSDAGDTAAGAPPGNPEGRDGTTGSATAAIAVATPAAAFCEWAGSKAFVGKRKRGCNGNVVLATPEFGVLEGGPCAYCGKPIRFKETP